jgi:hypothetical protein
MGVRVSLPSRTGGTIPRSTGTLEVTPEVTPEVRLIHVLVGEMTRQELQRVLGLKDDEHFRKPISSPRWIPA